MKSITVRLSDELWKEARRKMLEDSESFQKLLEKAVEEYVKKKEEQGDGKV